MIVFKQIRWKNFLSTGDNWTTVDLNKSPSTLIVGLNGSGKSTLLDALAFALFGKPHRNINKPQLVNTVNKKGALVEVIFQIGPNGFKVVRGIKPEVFEIWKNNELIDQSSHSREYQKILEQNIIKLNHKSFHQIVVLGSSSFIPFMQLPAQHRRAVIEDLLDINIFSKMNMILKGRNSLLKDSIKSNSYSTDIIDTKIIAQKKYIYSITEINDGHTKEKKDSIKKSKEEYVDLENKNKRLEGQVKILEEDLSLNLSKAHDKKQALLQYKARFNQKISDLVKHAKFFEDNDACPTCEQEIHDNTREKKRKGAKKKAIELKDATLMMDSDYSINEDLISELNNIFSQAAKKNNEISSNHSTMNSIRNLIDSLESEISKIKETNDVEDSKIDLAELEGELKNLAKNRDKLSEDYNYNVVMAEMLKDTGIKTKVIKEYIPVINQLVNQYLQILDFFVLFNLDENFSETIKSRHRDAFSYDSFSEGEKQRIDLALLFTWRMIAKMKNSVATNLLILDETFDSSLDHDGVDNLMKILYTLDDDTNVFVISHKGEILDGKFPEKLEFYREKNFSKIR